MEQAAPAAQPAVAEGPAAAELTQAAMPRPPSVDVAQAAQAALAALPAPGEAPEAERLLALCSKLAQVGVWCMCPFVWFSNSTACMLPTVTACVLLPPGRTYTQAAAYLGCLESEGHVRYSIYSTSLAMTVSIFWSTVPLC